MKTFALLLLSLSSISTNFAQKENEEIFFEQKVIVHPNPSTTHFKIVTEDQTSKTIIVVDYSGKTVYTATTSDAVVEIYCSDWLSGAYIINLYQTTGNSHYRIIKE